MFTSRLPKSTSARRPSNPNDGSTSMFGTQIPVSVRKANLFTPQPKRSLQTGLSSTSRKSYLNTDKKYQRPSKPAPDRDEQIRMFETLVDFLKRNAPGFPIPEAKRFFSSVSTTETSRLFEFLLNQIMPDFKINRLEIDVPEALATLNYPYIRSVTKSALVSITTRQAIVNLLVIFDWLIEYIEAVNQDGSLTLSHHLPTPVKVFCNMVNNPEGDDMTWQEKGDRPTGSGSAYDKLNQVNEEYDRLMKQKQEIDEIDRVVRDMAQDKEKSEKYCDELMEYFNFRKNELEEVQQILREKEEEREIESKGDESLLVFDGLDERKRVILSENVHLNETVKLAQQASEAEVHNCEDMLAKVSLEAQKVEKDIERRRQRCQFDKARLMKLLEAEEDNYRREKERRTEVDKLSLEFLKNSLDSSRLEAIAVVKKAIEEHERWNKIATLIAENRGIAKRACKKLVV